MINFNIAGTVVDDLTTDLRGLSDIKIVSVNGSFVLVTASEADGAITTFSLSGNGTPVLADVQKYGENSGTGRVSALNFAEVGNGVILLPTTRYEDQTSFYTIGNGGVLSGSPAPGSNGISGEGIGLSETVVIGASTFVFVQSYGGNTLTSYTLNANITLSKIQDITDTANSYLGDISALDHRVIGANSYLFVTSAFDAGLSVYAIAQNGSLSLRDTVTPSDGSGFAKPQDLVSFEVEGQAFVVMASAGTSSLTVFSVAGNGILTEVEHIIDTLETRFQNAALVEEFTYQGRQFLVAAGSDDGITVFEVLPGGALRVEASLADTYEITLDNVSGIAVEIIGGVPVLYVSSATDHGFTQIVLDIEQPPVAIEGTNQGDVLIGTDGDDLILGHGGNDVINGGGGDDVLVDGAGLDFLHGSHGADVFTFVKDAETDVIVDFNPEFDRIDLSAYAGVSSLSDLKMRDGCGRIVITVDGEYIVLMTDRHPMDVDDLTAAHFIF